MRGRSFDDDMAYLARLDRAELLTVAAMRGQLLGELRAIVRDVSAIAGSRSAVRLSVMEQRVAQWLRERGES